MDWKETISIKRESHTPLYYQIMEGVTQLIEEGHLRDGDLLPSETEFGKMLSVSRLTIRQAFGQLEHTGLITRQHGIGTFVSYKPSTAITPGRLSFTNKMQRLGKKVENRLLHMELISANKEVAEKLRIGAEDSVIRLVRLRIVDGDPMMIEHSFIDASMFPEFETVFPTQESLYKFLLSQYNVRVLSLEQTWQPIRLTSEQTELLGEPQGALGILTKLVACTNQEKPVEYSWSVVASSKCMFYFRFREEEPEN